MVDNLCKNQQYNQPNAFAQNQQGGQGNSGNSSNADQQGPKPVVSLPNGGGAIKSIGEKFETNPVNGTYNMSVPLAISPGRGGFTPQLGLSYNSGGGNSPFGLGWNIGVPSISRKTDKSLPQYFDAKDSDVYILSGAEDLVPVDDGARQEAGYDVKKYRPRTEGLFALIERWRNQTTGRIHWKSVSKENITSIYGVSDDSCVIDPENSRRIFTWNLEKTFDAKGNLMEYGYKKDDGADIVELNKNRKSTQTYLKRVLYGNTAMCDRNGNVTDNNWLFQLVFDYGDHHAENPTPTDNLNWPARQDPFSTFRAGFDIRTHRLCRRVLMFHQFDDDLGTSPVLLTATEFDYDENPFLTQLTKVTHRSYYDGQNDAMPPVRFEYTEAPTGTRLNKVDPKYLGNLPHGTGSTWQWADLYGEGLQSLLHTSNNAWYIKPNMGDQTMLQDEVVGENLPPQLKLGTMQLLLQTPRVANQNGMSFHLTDVDSDSQPEVVVNSPHMHGFYSFENNKWQPFQNFKQYPNIDLNSPFTRMMELSGDGLADIIVSHGTFFEIYLSKGKEGYHPAVRIPTAATERDGAKVVFADPQKSIHLADMTGDGLADIVRIRNSSVCYWPNLGYGRFGKQVIMKNSPMLDSPDIFNNSRIRLADVDGTGTTDIIYFNHKGAKFYKNQAGNGFSQAEIVSGFPRVDNLAQVEVMDLLGNGTSCMVWTSPLPNHTRQMYYIELTSGVKPYMLKSFTNGMGKETRLAYAPSTKFYLQDKANGKPWITKLPFPVQVLTRVETIEHVTGTKLVNKFAYHHGHYDTKEREFRGFGMVEQWDAETLSGESGVIGEDGNQAPVYTKSWFHLGFYKNKDAISTHFQSEYFSGDTDAWQLDDTVLPDDITPNQVAEACRALRGSLLRSEVYAQDGDENESVPYIVEEKNYQLKLLQPKGNNKHAVWLKTEGEALSYHYERDTNDPRIQHSLTLETDSFGNATKSAQVAYSRRNTSTIDGQNNTLVQYSETTFINEIDVNNNKYFIGVPYETRQLEVTGLAPEEPFTISSLKNSIQGATEID
ncbi:MAG: SpvB/TcaC N-terminal domain-containing protein, partial [Salinivirgaceae bacterium]